MNIKIKEVAQFALVSMYIGVTIFLIICFWDNLIGIQAPNNKGYGTAQIVGMAVSGLYSLWAWNINMKWNAYIKQIHGNTE